MEKNNEKIYSVNHDISAIKEGQISLSDFMAFIKLYNDSNFYGISERFYFDNQKFLITISDEFTIFGTVNILKEFDGRFYCNTKNFKVIEGYFEDIEYIYYFSVINGSSILFKIENNLVKLSGLVSWYIQDDLNYKFTDLDSLNSIVDHIERNNALFFQIRRSLLLKNIDFSRNLNKLNIATVYYMTKFVGEVLVDLQHFYGVTNGNSIYKSVVNGGFVFVKETIGYYDEDKDEYFQEEKNYQVPLNMGIDELLYSFNYKELY